MQFLEQLDAAMAEAPDESNLFLQLLEEPEAGASPLPLAPGIKKAADAVERGLGFTPSQAEAWQAIRSQRVTAVWGPPGTGKTHFLASTILGLAEAHAQAGKPFRVLVTAFTHAAIENLLRKISRRQGELQDLRAQARWARPSTGKGLTPALPPYRRTNWRGSWPTTST